MDTDSYVVLFYSPGALKLLKSLLNSDQLILYRLTTCPKSTLHLAPCQLGYFPTDPEKVRWEVLFRFAGFYIDWPINEQ